jgi:hypothetical protein
MILRFKTKKELETIEFTTFMIYRHAWQISWWSIFADATFPWVMFRSVSSLHSECLKFELVFITVLPPMNSWYKGKNMSSLQRCGISWINILSLSLESDSVIFKHFENVKSKIRQGGGKVTVGRVNHFDTSQASDHSCKSATDEDGRGFRDDELTFRFYT